MDNKELHLIFPHQLFKNSEVLEQVNHIYLVEEFLFFNHYKFHKQKIGFHRASMKAYQDYLEDLGKNVTYVEAIDERSDVRQLLPHLKNEGIKTLHIIDPTDNWLVKHIKLSSDGLDIK
jgi:deoxyribodipyrimidine photolyase-related protein